MSNTTAMKRSQLNKTACARNSRYLSSLEPGTFLGPSSIFELFGLRLTFWVQAHLLGVELIFLSKAFCYFCPIFLESRSTDPFLWPRLPTRPNVHCTEKNKKAFRTFSQKLSPSGPSTFGLKYDLSRRKIAWKIKKVSRERLHYSRASFEIIIGSVIILTKGQL